MTRKHPDLLIHTETTDINREFLRILTEPPLTGHARDFGLDVITLKCLRRLESEQLDELAGTPLLLAEFRPLPDSTNSCKPQRMVADSKLSDDWQQEVTGFANRLLTFIWQVTRREPALSAFRLGLDQADAPANGRTEF